MSTTASLSDLVELDRPSASSLHHEDARVAPRVSRKRRSWHPIAICLASYAVISVLIFLPVGPFDSRHLPIAGVGNPAGNDPFQMVWFLSYVPYAITHGLSIFHTNFIDYPRGINLSDNTSVPLLGIASWPITATLGPIASFNFLIRLSFALSGASMFLVLRRWCVSWEGPFLGGLLYALSPYMAAQALHLDLIFVPIPPLLVLCADEFIRRQRMAPVLLGSLIGVASAIQFLTSPDVLSGCLVIAIIVGVGLAITFRGLIRARLAYMAKAGTVALGLFSVLAGYPIYEMLLGPGHIGGPVVPISLLQLTRADLFGAIVPTSNQLVTIPAVTAIGNHFVGGNLSENGTYIGIPLLIVLIMIVRKRPRNATVVVLASAAAAAWLLSLGAHLSIGGWSSPVPLPGVLLTHLPLLDSTIPARYALYVFLFASMLIAIGVERLQFDAALRIVGKIGPSPAVPLGDAVSQQGSRALLRRKWGRTKGQRGLLALGGIVLLSLVPNVPFASQAVPWPTALPATIRSVVPQGSVVLAVPFPNPSNSEAMAWQAMAGMHYRLIGGYANILDPGRPYGQRQPPQLAPSHVQQLLGFPKLGYLLPWISPNTAETQLLTYLARYSVRAVVFQSGGAATSQAYWYLIGTLGQPQVVRPGFAIWLSQDGAWGSPGAVRDYETKPFVTPDPEHEHNL
jgi:hypothetical protein